MNILITTNDKESVTFPNYSSSFLPLFSLPFLCHKYRNGLKKKWEQLYELMDAEKMGYMMEFT